MKTDELFEAFEKLNLEDKRKVINYAKHLGVRKQESNEISYSYLSGVSESTRAYFIGVLENENLNLWASMYNILESKSLESLDDVVSYYYDKYSDKRPYIKGRQKELLEIARAINKSRRVKGKRYLKD